MNGGSDEPSTAVVNVLVNICFTTKCCDSGLGMVRMFGGWHDLFEYKAAAVDPLNVAADFAEPHHPSPHPPWTTWTGINSDRRVSTQEDSAKNVRQYGERALLGTTSAMRMAEGNRPQVLNASASTPPATSGPLPDGDTVSHEEEESLSHRDERQIMLDTDRSFVHYPSGEAPPLTVPPIQCAPDETECSCRTIVV